MPLSLPTAHTPVCNTTPLAARGPLAADTQRVQITAWKSAHKLRKLTLWYSTSTKILDLIFKERERVMCKKQLNPAFPDTLKLQNGGNKGENAR